MGWSLALQRRQSQQALFLQEVEQYNKLLTLDESVTQTLEIKVEQLFNK